VTRLLAVLPTLCTAAAGTIKLLLGSPQKGKAETYCFQSTYCTSWEHIHSLVLWLFLKLMYSTSWCMLNAFPLQTAISSPLTAEVSNLVTTATPLDTFLFEKPIFLHLGLRMEDRGFSCEWQLQK